MAIQISKATGVLVTTVKALGLGSAYFGPCECCGKSVSETFKRHISKEIQRQDGTKFLVPNFGVYGHEACVIAA